MARIRSVHPGQWRDQDFVECGFGARLLAIALRNEADDQGVFEWKPKQIKMNCFPGDSVDIGSLLDELVSNRIIKQFEVEGRVLGAIRNFRLYQRPKKPNSTFPLTDEIRDYVALSGSKFGNGGEIEDDERAVSFPTVLETPKQMKEVGDKMKEVGDNKNRPSVASRPPAVVSPEFIRLPTNRFETAQEEVVVDEAFVEQFQGLYPAVDIRQSLRSMRGWLLTNPSKRKTKTGMMRFAASWLSKQQDQGKPNGQARKTTAHDNLNAGVALYIASLNDPPDEGREGQAGADADATRFPLLAS